jgi:multidrug efflux pump
MRSPIPVTAPHQPARPSARPRKEWCRSPPSAGAGNTPIAVYHDNLFAASTISFNLAPGVSLGEATAAVDDRIARLGMPASIHGTFQGTARAFQQSLANEPFLIAAALLAVYIVLGVLYESYVHPITILSTLPSAGVGAALALIATNSEFNLMALLGVILLIGIVKKNAIMMIDFALDAERNLGLASREAIYQACLKRFRPIIMTTMAAMFGAVPLAIGFGEGAELRRSPARDYDRRRAARQPAADPIHDARHLSLPRPPPAVDATPVADPRTPAR